MTRVPAQRTQALRVFHAMSAGAVLLAGIGLVAARATEPATVLTAGSDSELWSELAEVDCLVTHFTEFAPGARSAWNVRDQEQTLTVTAGRAVVQSHDEHIVTLEPGQSVTVRAFDRHRYGAATQESATISVSSACTQGGSRPPSGGGDAD